MTVNSIKFFHDTDKEAMPASVLTLIMIHADHDYDTENDETSTCMILKFMSFCL